jgi:hypothetical protein
MKKLLLSAAIALCATPAFTDAALVIAAGKPGGGYDARAQQIAERLSQRGLTATVENKNGSDEISLAVCGGRADIGIMQIDAIYARALEGCTMKPVSVYGEEVAVILFPPDAENDALSDLTAQNAVMVDTIGSGTDLFWRTAVSIEQGDDGTKDEWSQARIVNDPLELAHASASMGDVDAVVLVRKPDSPDIFRLLELGWTVGEMWDRDIDDLQFNDGALYGSEKQGFLYAGGRSQTGWVYRVRSFIVVSNTVATGDRRTFATITGATQ